MYAYIGFIRLGKFVDLRGLPLSVQQISVISKEQGFGKGYVFKGISSSSSLTPRAFAEACAKHEDYWVRKLEKLNTPSLFQVG